MAPASKSEAASTSSMNWLFAGTCAYGHRRISVLKAFSASGVQNLVLMDESGSVVGVNIFCFHKEMVLRFLQHCPTCFT